MVEKLRYQSEDEIKEQETLERLKEEGGISFRQETDPESGETKDFVNVLGVEIETYTSKEDIEEIRKDVVLHSVDQKILKTAAQCYKMGQVPYFESDPGVGKTFDIELLIRLIHGKDSPILSIQGSPRTSELEILGHWAPKGLKEGETEEYKAILEDLMGRGQLGRFQKQLNEELERLNADFASEKINSEEFQTRFGEISQKYVDESRKVLMETSQMAKFLKPEAEWEFKTGALLQCYSGRDGRGYPLFIDEFNLIPSNYQQVILQAIGKRSEMADSISFWGNSGKTVYKKGKDSAMFLAGNFPENTTGRSDLSAPMTDRLVWTVISPTEGQQKKRDLIRSIGGTSRKRTQEIQRLENIEVPVKSGVRWRGVLDEQLADQIGDAVDLIDKDFVDFYTQVGDEILRKGQSSKSKRSQLMEFSFRNPVRLFTHLDNFQVRDKETGFVDFNQALSNAFEMYYVSRLADEDKKDKARGIFKQIMEGETGKTTFEGQKRTRKEILAILSERASLTPAAREQMEGQSREAQERELMQASHAAEDAEEKMLDNPNIPEDIKKMLRGEK
jgi:MoxR-like ATPase